MTAETTTERTGACENWDAQWRPFLVIAAITPVLVTLFLPNMRWSIATAIDDASWLIFLIDLVARLRINRRYLRSGDGLFDLAIVVLTLPWGAHGLAGDAGFISIFRLARIIRLVRTLRVGDAAQKMWDRLGRLTAVIAATALVTATIVVNAEPAESGFEHFGDGLWWALVSLTTVGYGDLVPVTTSGRLAAIILMLVGLGALGTIAAALASMFAGNKTVAFEHEVLDELAALRNQVDALERALRDLDKG